jgi:hypothetical protein
LTPTLIQIVPPGEGGVRDYAHCLQSEWSRQGHASQLLALSRQAARDIPLAQRVQALRGASGCAGSAPCSIVLHFSGYGYAPRGLCAWLADELHALRDDAGWSVRIVVVFHELFASSPPWRSAFWLSRLQAAAALRVARSADALWTNTETHAEWLRGIAAREVPVHVRPVFSNVGEPGEGIAAMQRLPRAVVFGSPSTRQRALDGVCRFETALCRLGVEELVEVGSGAPVASALNTPSSLPHRQAGRLDVPALTTLLQGSRFALIDYPSKFLAKSSVFAAYAAHGCVVLNTRSAGRDSDGLAAGRDYIDLHAASAPAARQIAPGQHDAMASRLARWYAQHRLADQASELWTLSRG